MAMPDETDLHWVGRCLDGHPDDFRHLVERYERMVRAYAGGRLRGRAEAEEAAHETFVRAYAALGRLREPYSFPSWLMGIAAHVIKERLRENRRRSQTVSSDMESLAADPPGDTGEEDLALRQAVAQLDEPYREVILLRYYAGLSCSEMAARLGRPVGTVTKTLSRAYEMLRSSLEPDAAGREE
jgi:RNA polymerase sigma-70 factor, ECF subfamily